MSEHDQDNPIQEAGWWVAVCLSLLAVVALTVFGGCSGLSAERRGWEDGYSAYHAHTYQKGFQRGYRAAELIDRGMDVPEEDKDLRQ
jgi:hypothetical protein